MGRNPLTMIVQDSFCAELNRLHLERIEWNPNYRQSLIRQLQPTYAASFGGGIPGSGLA